MLEAATESVLKNFRNFTKKKNALVSCFNKVAGL